MKITKLKLLILVSVLMLSIFVANVANIIDVDSHALGKITSSEADTRWSKPKKYDIGDSFEHLVWFLQVSLSRKKKIIFFPFSRVDVLTGVLYFLFLYLFSIERRFLGG